MTAKGKITTARLTIGTRIMVRPTDSGDEAWPSPTKVKDATPATVQAKGYAPLGRYDRRRQWRLVLLTDDRRRLVIERSAPSQTYWLAPARTN